MLYLPSKTGSLKVQTLILKQPVNGTDFFSRHNSVYQPEPISAWDIQSPTVGDNQRSPWNFPENNSPRVASDILGSNRILPRVARPVSTPVVPVAPLPTPQPDYSPPLGRRPKHEPNPYNYPLRPALKNKNQYGRTIL